MESVSRGRKRRQPPDLVYTLLDKTSRVAPFTTRHHADLSLARLCYAVCRLLRPEIVLETGVAYGVTTALVLKALQVNGKGRLYSIDLPPLGENADAFVGYLVPEALRARWTVNRGVSKRVLPQLLPRLGRVDLFIPDFAGVMTSPQAA